MKHCLFQHTNSIVNIPEDEGDDHVIRVGFIKSISCVLLVDFYVLPLGCFSPCKHPVFLSDTEMHAQDVYRFAEGRVDADMHVVNLIQRAIPKDNPHRTSS